MKKSSPTRNKTMQKFPVKGKRMQFRTTAPPPDFDFAEKESALTSLNNEKLAPHFDQ